MKYYYYRLISLQYVVSFHARVSKGKNGLKWIEKTINLLDKENELVAWINEVSIFGIIRTTYLRLVIRQKDKDKDIVQTTTKKNLYIILLLYVLHSFTNVI